MSKKIDIFELHAFVDVGLETLKVLTEDFSCFQKKIFCACDNVTEQNELNLALIDLMKENLLKIFEIGINIFENITIYKCQLLNKIMEIENNRQGKISFDVLDSVNTTFSTFHGELTNKMNKFNDIKYDLEQIHPLPTDKIFTSINDIITKNNSLKTKITDEDDEFVNKINPIELNILSFQNLINDYNNLCNITNITILTQELEKLKNNTNNLNIEVINVRNSIGNEVEIQNIKDMASGHIKEMKSIDNANREKNRIEGNLLFDGTLLLGGAASAFFFLPAMPELVLTGVVYGTIDMISLLITDAYDNIDDYTHYEVGEVFNSAEEDTYGVADGINIGKDLYDILIYGLKKYLR